MPLHKMDQIINGLFLGGIMAASDKKLLSDNGITHVLSLTDPIFNYEKLAGKSEHITYLHIKAEDSEDQHLAHFFTECVQFIHQARLSGGNILVHCMMGVSRSATMVIVYLMTITQLPFPHVLSAVQAQRPIVEPNRYFLEQIQEFQTSEKPVEEQKRLYTRFGQWKMESDDIKSVTFLCKKNSAMKKMENRD